MAASVVTSTKANQKSLYRALQRKSTAAHVSPLRPAGVALIPGSESIATTSLDDVGDEVTLLEFPRNTRLLGLQVQMTDCDTDGAPALVVDFNAEDASGTETTLIDNTDVGQGGGYDELDVDVGAFGLDVSDQTLRMKVVTAAATPAAGTVSYTALVILDAVTSW
jgi:hypothetical protein